MKSRYIPVLSLTAALLLFTSCKKEDTAEVSKTVAVSYPTITLEGDEYIHLPVGGVFTDDGATLVDDITGASSHITATENNIDPSAPGVYAVKYSASNSNGFTTEVIRTVLVLNYTVPSGLDPTLNLAGTYERQENGILVNVIRMDTGLYIIDNFGGSGTVYPAYMTTPTSTTIDVPAQVTFDAFAIDCAGETLELSPDTMFYYSVDAAGFGTAVRHFLKL